MRKRELAAELKRLKERQDKIVRALKFKPVPVFVTGNGPSEDAGTCARIIWVNPMVAALDD